MTITHSCTGCALPNPEGALHADCAMNEPSPQRCDVTTCPAAWATDPSWVLIRAGWDFCLPLKSVSQTDLMVLGSSLHALSPGPLRSSLLWSWQGSTGPMPFLPKLELQGTQSPLNMSFIGHVQRNEAAQGSPPPAPDWDWNSDLLTPGPWSSSRSPRRLSLTLLFHPVP